MAIRLFDYQREMRDSVLEAFGSHNSVMCQMPTGTGKTHVLASVVSEYAKGKTVWVVAHRRELIEQIERTWAAFYKDKRNAPEVRVLSIQWLARNWDKAADESPAMIVIDEAHHALAETYRELFRRYPDAKKLGMTATPYRLSGKGFTDLFDILLQSRSIPDFIMAKRLSLFDYYAVPQNSKIRRQIAMLKKRGADGDYQTKELELSLNTPRNIEYLYNSLMRYAKGRRGIVYAINISHARAIAEYYAAQGLRCCAIDCNTPAKEREAKIEAFRRGDIDVMVNVDIFSEGFDCPEVEFIQLARPTLSLAVYLQQIGRGLRKAKGKKYCVILDNVGLSHTFGTPIRKWKWERMFRGNAGNIRIDAGNSRELLKHYGYPGKLVDEPMEKIINHEEMATAIRYQKVLRYFSSSNLVGVVLNGNVVAKKRVLSVIALKQDAVALRLADQSACLVFASGREMPLPDDCKDFDILDNKILKITTPQKEIFIDLITKQEFRQPPVIEKYGPMEFIGNREFVWRRIYNWTYYYYRDEISHPSWNGFYFKIYGICPIATKAFIPTAKLGGIRECSYSYVVLFPSDFHEYYLVEELADGSIILVDINLGYYLVKPDLTHKFLFTATSYASSKKELEEWMVKLRKKRSIPHESIVESKITMTNG